MHKLITGAAVAASALALAVAPAMASGGRAAGGGATGGGTATGGGGTTTATGGGGGGGGGGSKGGINDVVIPAPPPPPPPVPGPACATLPSVTAPVGYYLTFAALWNDFTVRSCSSGTQTVNIAVTNTNVATGQVDYSVGTSYFLAPGANVNGVLDNDFAPFSTDYDVRVEARDEAGNVLDSSSVRTTTPPQR
ncbi:MAG: hypothetical protein QOF57_2282 [Frankiaceae bacterium]|nr:hypothetical protein [Frankiaceae bacterium]